MEKVYVSVESITYADGSIVPLKIFGMMDEPGI